MYHVYEYSRQTFTAVITSKESMIMDDSSNKSDGGRASERESDNEKRVFVAVITLIRTRTINTIGTQQYSSNMGCCTI